MSDASTLHSAAIAVVVGAPVILAGAGTALYRSKSTRDPIGGPDYAAFKTHAREKRKRRPLTGAWAQKWQTDQLAVDGPTRDRVSLGWAYGRLIATPPRHSTLVIGPTSSGKTAGYAIPAVLEWDGPALVVSAKPDLALQTTGARMERGRVQVIDYGGLTGLPCAGWSPLVAASTWTGALAIANMMSRVSGTTSGLGGSDHWDKIARQLLAPMLHAASIGGRTMDHVLSWVRTRKLDDAKTILMRAGRRDAVELIKVNVEDEPKQAASAFNTVRTVLDAYLDPRILATTRTVDVTPDALLDGGANTIYLVGTPDDQKLLAPVFLGIIGEILAAAVARGAAGCPPRLLVVLDEAANIAPVANLAGLASTCRDFGIQLVTIFQDLAQARVIYDREWQTIANNHTAKVLLPGCTDPDTLNYFVQVAGREVHLDTTTSSGPGGKTIAEHHDWRPILDEGMLRELLPGRGLLITGRTSPVLFGLRPYFEDADLAGMLQDPAVTENVGAARTEIAWADLLELVADDEAVQIGDDPATPIYFDGAFYDMVGEIAVQVTSPGRLPALEAALLRRVSATRDRAL